MYVSYIFWYDASQYEVYVMQIFVHYFNFWNLGGKGEKNIQLLEHVNGEEDNVSKLLLHNIIFTIKIRNFSLCWKPIYEWSLLT